VVERYVCVHGHFYQPPREHPWLEVVELTDDAYPFHDWNERITAECYRPNTRARILDGQGRIRRIVNNYARMSFNVGPTLLAWMEDASPATHADIIEADRRSMARFGGHGSAMAQVYNHVIMPLASERDQRTQIRWGIQDFRRRFGRDPEGMWLAEAAANDTTLDLLAQHGIAFTVLAPDQAARVRREGTSAWQDVRGGRVDPTMPYRVNLPSGRSIVVFFYDGPISRAVAFEGLLESGERFSSRLLQGFNGRAGAQLVHIATDGESYGHHHRHGEMALADALERLLQREDLRLTNYAQFLALHPPTHEAEIVQNSSWSCIHGIERWRSDCGCTTGEPGRHQRWRGPLRDSLDWLNDHLGRWYEAAASELFTDPWAARDDYIDVVLDRSPATIDAFLERHSPHRLGTTARRRAIQLLEVQRHALLMYTSCGWFFEELSRPEPMQVLRYAARAIQLAQDVLGLQRTQVEGGRFLEEAFLDRLAAAESNDPRYGDGRGIYEQDVRPAVTDLAQVGAHFAISSLTWNYGEAERIGAYEVVRDDYQLREAGRAKMAYGRLTVRSVVDMTEVRTEFGVVHLGDHNVACGVRARGDDDAYHALRDDLERHFEVADFPEVIRAIDDHLGSHAYSLRTLFRDEQHRILDTLLATTIDETEAIYRGTYRTRAPLMRFLTDIGATVPRPLQRAAEIVLNAELRDAVASTNVDPQHVRALLAEAERFDVPLDSAGLAHALTGAIQRITDRLAPQLLSEDEAVFSRFGDDERTTVDRVDRLIEVTRLAPFDVDISPAQDAVWRILRRRAKELTARAAAGEKAAIRWRETLEHVADALGVVPPAA
jgi:alpha-amylase/alpha-mannosidase (GH57 family)